MMKKPEKTDTPVFDQSAIERTSLGTLFGRAWMLYRKNLKTCTLLLMVPVILQLLAQIAFTVPSYLLSQTTVQPGVKATLWGLLFLGPLLVFVTIAAHLFCVCILVRILNSAIIHP